MSEKTCKWSDKVCQERQISADNSNRASPARKEFLYCTECMFRDATKYLEEYDKLVFMERNKEFALKYCELTKNREILNSQWKEYWKEREKRG